MNWKWLVTHSFALMGAALLYFIVTASLTTDPAFVASADNTTGMAFTTGGVLWQSRVMDLIIQFVAMFAGAMGILALTKEGGE